MARKLFWMAVLCLFATTTSMAHNHEVFHIEAENNHKRATTTFSDHDELGAKGERWTRLLAHRQDRRVEYQHRLDSIRDQLEETPSDERLQRKAIAYEKKLASLSETLDERQLEHLVNREELFGSIMNEQPRLRGSRLELAKVA